MDEHDPQRPTTATTSPHSRRGFLRGSTVAGFTAAGFGVATTQVGAQFRETDVSVLAIENRQWGKGMRATGRLPVVDELLAYVHGFDHETSPADQAGSLRDSLAAGGYDPDQVVAVEWPTTVNYDAARGLRDEDVGAVLANLAERFAQAGGGSLRLVGHSLGTQCVFEALTSLSNTSEIETVATLGATAYGSAVCTGSWADGLENACQIRNYHSRNDETVITGYGDGDDDTALGAEGARCDPAANYMDVDVTDSVDEHFAYIGAETVGADLAGAIEEGSCDGAIGDGSGGTDGSTDPGDSDDVGWWRSDGSGWSGGGSGRGRGNRRASWW